MELIDLTGQRFGMLTVIERAPDKVLSSGKRYIMWLCRCDCGNTCTVDGGSLRRGQTKTCGCWKKAQDHSRDAHSLGQDAKAIDDSG